MQILELIKQISNKLPYIRSLKRKLDFYESNLLIKPGHFYSPIIDYEAIRKNQDQIFNCNKPLFGLDLNQNNQFELLQQFKEYYKDIPFTDELQGILRYYYKNEAYSYSDVIFLYSIVRHYKPKKIIEVGSGYSSAAMLDINELFFNSSINMTFIEPYPEILKGLVKAEDRFALIKTGVQETNIETFKLLEENDILFIDSTHVAKTNSDVLYELFTILPSLKKGVKIHFHDIFYPFEYPKEWVIDQKRNWNEIYFLRAFLMYNTNFKIIAMNTYLEYTFEDWFKENMPLCMINKGGSIWLEKIA